MSAPEDSPSPTDDPLERAQARLDEACARVAARLDRLAAGSAVIDKAAPNAAQEAARAREAELAEAARSASRALDDAMDELRALRGGSVRP